MSRSTRNALFTTIKDNRQTLNIDYIPLNHSTANALFAALLSNPFCLDLDTIYDTAIMDAFRTLEESYAVELVLDRVPSNTKQTNIILSEIESNMAVMNTTTFESLKQIHVVNGEWCALKALSARIQARYTFDSYNK